MIEGGQLLKLASAKAEAIAKDISNCMSRWQNQQPVSLKASECAYLRMSSVVG
jgi:hypothetical protein